MLIGVMIVSALGFLVCLYGLYIESKLKHDLQYKAACDLSDQVSCTKTFLSPYSKLFGISNIYIGMMFYAGMLLLGFLHQTQLAFLGAVAAAVASVLFAYILVVKIRTFCLVCTSVYVVNIMLLIVTYYSL